MNGLLDIGLEYVDIKTLYDMTGIDSFVFMRLIESKQIDGKDDLVNVQSLNAWFHVVHQKAKANKVPFRVQVRLEAPRMRDLF